MTYLARKLGKSKSISQENQFIFNHIQFDLHCKHLHCYFYVTVRKQIV